MDTVTRIVAFLVVLGVLVVFHELGHYLRRALVRGRRCCGSRSASGASCGRAASGPTRTEWAVSAIPLGGYVKMADEREGAVPLDDLPRAFNRQSVWKRIAIVAAGPDREPAARGAAVCRYLRRRHSGRSGRCLRRPPWKSRGRGGHP